MSGFLNRCNRRVREIFSFFKCRDQRHFALDNLSVILNYAVMDVAQIIEAFGGQEAAAILFGVSRPTLYLWEETGFPPKRWKQIARLAERLSISGVTLDTIMQAKPSRTRTPRTQAAA